MQQVESVNMTASEFKKGWPVVRTAALGVGVGAPIPLHLCAAALFCGSLIIAILGKPRPLENKASLAPIKQAS